jgi:hypothetical protein
VKARPDQKIEKALDQALADTFPASDPVAFIQPTSAGLGENPPLSERKAAPAPKPAKGIFQRWAGL